MTFCEIPQNGHWCQRQPGVRSCILSESSRVRILKTKFFLKSVIMSVVSHTFEIGLRFENPPVCARDYYFIYLYTCFNFHSYRMRVQFLGIRQFTVECSRIHILHSCDRLINLSCGPSVFFFGQWHQVAMTPDCLSCPLTSFQDMLCSVRLHLSSSGLSSKGPGGRRRHGVGEAVFPLGNIR